MPTATGPGTGSPKNPTDKRYRLPGIEREGIAQLSLLETALWPLDGTRRRATEYRTTYAFGSGQAQRQAQVTVRSALGLQPIDEYVLWGLLGTSLDRREDNDGVLIAKPRWMLKRLGLRNGGSQYAELRESLLRLSTASYQNTGFYNPETQEHEYVSFQFLSFLLPTVGGLGRVVDNDRCWRIEWNPAFYRFSQLTGGSLLFDLDLYRQLTPASRRLFLKLKDRFWRTKVVHLNVEDLTINGLGFSADRPLFKRKYDLTVCLRELLEHGVIALGRGQTDVKQLFWKRSKGCYVVVCYEGEYFRQPQAARSQSQQEAIQTDPLFEPLRQLGMDTAAIRRVFAEHARGRIRQWLTITEAALHEKPRGFPGFRVSPAAFLIDGLQHNRLPPDWMHAHEKRQRERQWEQERIAVAAQERQLQPQYVAERAAALQVYLRSPEGHEQYDAAYGPLLVLHQRSHPHDPATAAAAATRAYVEEHHFQFPSFAEWSLGRSGSQSQPS
ncbi:MAG: hypothetical protein KF777_14475 [Planctomycetaceae bacterium]|nr:hypothetical protein [Planctomycetaceae bacterium]